MPKVKIEDLTAAAQLDHFCAIAQGWYKSNDKNWWLSKTNSDDGVLVIDYHPTTNATQCNEIQEREKISINWEYDAWEARKDNYDEPHNDFIATGKTAKQAIIRCFVKSKLGDEVEV